MALIGDKRGKIYYYLTLLSVILLAVYIDHNLGNYSLNLNFIHQFISVLIVGIILIIITLLLITAFVRTVIKDKKKLTKKDLIIETIKETIVPALMLALLTFVMGFVSRIINFHLWIITEFELTLILAGTITGIILYYVFK